MNNNRQRILLDLLLGAISTADDMFDIYELDVGPVEEEIIRGHLDMAGKCVADILEDVADKEEVEYLEKKMHM